MVKKKKAVWFVGEAFEGELLLLLLCERCEFIYFSFQILSLQQTVLSGQRK